MVPIDRDKNLRVMMSEDELRMLHELADLAGLTASDIVRTLIRQEHAAKVGQKGAKRPVRK